jgi:hypothetical protein
MRNSDEPDTICGVHNKIINIIEEWEEKYPLRETPKEIQDIYLLCQDAKKMGIKMENRLKKYKKAIERLGFIRRDSK